jgi:hypothetical protein
VRENPGMGADADQRRLGAEIGAGVDSFEAEVLALTAKAPISGVFAEPLTDSNRRPPRYHGGGGVGRAFVSLR